MVNTRSAVKRELVKKGCEPTGSQSLRRHAESEPPKIEEIEPQMEQKMMLSRTFAVEGSTRSAPNGRVTAAAAGSKTVAKSTSSSSIARRKRLELQAAEEKAKIQMELIDKRLQADIADLEDEENYSPQPSEGKSNEEIEKWLDRSHQQQAQTALTAQPAHDDGLYSGGPRPPPAPAAAHADAAGSEGTVQMLASALQKIATAVASNAGNSNLLSRMSTPRDLPSFSGDPMEWLHFKQALEESTSLCSFSEKENLWRLRKCLHGAAREAVAALLITATSTREVMSTLELQFGNPEIIISKIINDIRKLPPMSTEYHRDIVTFSVKVQNFVAAVRAVGREDYLQGMNITNIILSKFPAVLIPRWSDYSFPLIKDAAPGRTRLEILAEFLRDEAVKITSTANLSVLCPRSDKYKNTDHSATRPYTVLVNSNQTGAVNSNNNKCSFCRAIKHELTNCRKFKRALRKDRWQHVKRFGICFKCLISRHDREQCPAPACDKEGCGGAHHRLLHYDAAGSSEPRRDTAATTSRTPASSEADLEDPPAAQTVAHVGTRSCKVLLKVVPVRIHGPNGAYDTSALLDDGSTISLVSEELAARAGLRGRPDTVHVRGAWTHNEMVFKSNIVQVSLSGVNNVMHSITARTCKQLNLPLQTLSIVEFEKYDNLKFLKNESLLCYYTDCKPELLIGQDNCHLLQSIESRIGKNMEPSATLTPLGWCVHGVVPVQQQRAAASAGLVNFLTDSGDHDVARELRDIHDEVRRGFSIDALGVSTKPRPNSDDESARRQLEESATLKDGRWFVSLPWKDKSCKMPTESYATALNRLKSVEKKMAANKDFATRYTERIQHLLDNSFASQLTADGHPTERTWYLPHFGVDNPNKNKLRLVFDAAAKTKGLSLNDYLLTGPDLLESLFGIMLRFRENKIAVIGDIKVMFLRVKIHKEDQDALRFLWRPSQSLNTPVKTYTMESLIFGASCSPFIAQFIKNKNADRFELSKPAAVHAIKKQHYMDDYIDSFSDEATATEMVNNVSYIHKSGGFEIRNWASNSSAVLDSLPPATLSTAAIRFKIDKQSLGERTLGLIWYPSEDLLGFDVSLKRIPDDILTGKQRPTKRILLRVVMSIFDVFGMLAPFTIQGKIMLQDTWRSNIGWDDAITDNTFEKWVQWVELLKTIEKVRIPRCYSSIFPVLTDTGSVTSAAMTSPQLTRPRSASDAATPSVGNYNNFNELQLHVFCDASTQAMCAVAYFRWIDCHGNVSVAFVSSRCRVAPVQPASVPRLELQAALLAARLADTLIKEHRLNVTKRFFWCDASVVLHWINNDARNYKTFVANRLGEIDELTEINEWRYIPTKLNVADLATRDSFDNDTFMSKWCHGPEFLRAHESSWPQQTIVYSQLDKNIECVTVVRDYSPVVLPVPDPERFSSWLRLKRATANVLKFIGRCRRQAADIDCELMEEAERLLIKHAQSQSFSEELANLKEGKSISKKSRLLTLSPYLDEHGVLRSGGRIDAADAPPGAKRPVILDGRHHVARLIVLSYHLRLAHGSQETVVNELKQRYWVIKIRPTVKSVATRCIICRMRRCTPQVPRMGDLPEARMAHHLRPFTHCGLDLFGPMEVTVGRRREKALWSLIHLPHSPSRSPRNSCLL
ncbi:unnamed protein product [Plutella xylostella]|uniref:(diamondback moth) hypothetical protein n=1 Tax=Plutella xylostella TaxID=51655 RepID=A0A8S4GDL1_PLUXY|nr:unnamed protein product [Plutella xylostella]